LPANAAKSEVNHYHKDGSMRFFTNDFGNPDAYYEPNSKGGAVEDPTVEEPPMKISGDAKRYEENDTYGEYKQPGDLFRMFDEGQKNRLFSNVAAAMQGVSMEIIERQLVHFDKADPAYGNGVRKALGISELENY
ncbi:MAG: catalase-related domain-containing protein, partial [Cellulophaga sp.]|uniref:catalase-related domain-containing protein n=1 Tax=Cellulophaga sp. TaxID=1972202 RepID=UPI003266C5C9